MKKKQQVLNLLRTSLDSELAEKIVEAGYTLTALKNANKSELEMQFSGEDLERILAAVKRKPISKDVLQRLVEECDWKCCVCRKSDKEGPVVVHHIVEHSTSQDDSYDNLVILCLNHHALAHSKWEISRHPLPPELIRIRKEQWIEAVRQYKEATRPGANIDEVVSRLNFAPRIRTGKELLSILRGASFSDFDHDELVTEDEAELIGNFLGDIQDLTDYLDIAEARDIVQIGFQYGLRIKELEENKFLVYGKRELRKMNVGGMIDTWAVATIRIIRWTPDREAAGTKWNEIVSKINQSSDPKEQEVLFSRLVELLAQYVGGL